MRPVNLLPERDRVRRPAPDQPGNASYVVLGVLGALLLGVVVYVVTQNQVNSRTSQIAVAEQERAEAEQRAAGLASFGEFAQIKETRVQSVTELAKSRFDWERLMRELALVLPEDTWLTAVTAASAPQSTDGTTPAPPTPATPTTPGAVATTGPSLSVTGCSESQERVAVVLVRLRKLHRATDVQLTESAESESAGGAIAGASAPAGPTLAGTDAECSFFKFDATVTFEPGTDDLPEAEELPVPRALGGGA